MKLSTGPSPGGGAGGDSTGPRTPTTPPPLGGLRPTVSCQRCRPQESTGAERYMGTKAARGEFLSTLHPNTILKPNHDPNTHPNPQPSPNPSPTPNPNPSPNPHPSPNPSPSPSPSPSPNPRLGSEFLLGSGMESDDVAKAALNVIWRILFSPINMAGMPEPARCKG